MNNNKEKSFIQSKLHINGFTLVELLVVISIIALLLSILMPSLSAARENAKRVVCRSNQKQISLIVNLYSADNNGSLPWMEEGDSNWKKAVARFGVSGADSSRYYPIHTYFEDMTQILHCPSNTKYPMGDELPVTVDGGAPDSLRNSYEWWRYGVGKGVWEYEAKKLVSVEKPSQQFVTMDFCPGPLSTIGRAAGYKMIISLYHKERGAGVSFVDGHAEWVLPSDDWQNANYWVYPPQAPCWP